MRRVGFYVGSGQISAESVAMMLSLVHVNAEIETVRSWTQLERVLAYDWAYRVHLRASDNPTPVRARPTFIPVDWGTP